MQVSGSPHTWVDAATNAIGGALSVGVAWFLSWLYKRQSKGEVRENNARTERTRAETDDLKVTTGARVGEIVSTMAQKLGETQILVGQLREKIAERNSLIENLKAENLQFKTERDLYELQIRELQAEAVLLKKGNGK